VYEVSEVRIDDDRLDSWKEIAAYLRRNVRTVTRWEKFKGLPVHRIPGGRRHAVFSYREELEAWMNQRLSQTTDNHSFTPAMGSKAANGLPARESITPRLNENKRLVRPFDWPFE
jgi:hypothetical protein